MTRLREGTDGIRAVVADPRCVSIAEGVKATLMRYSLLNDAEVSSRRARDTLKKVSDLAVSLDSELTSHTFHIASFILDRALQCTGQDRSRCVESPPSLSSS